MNKKLFGTALLGLLLSAATGTFVSCKDYDDDIENLQAQIDKLSSLQTSVDGLKSDLAGVQSTCQANIASAIADLKNGDVKKALADAADAAAKASAASAEAANATTAATNAQAAADAAATAAAKAQAAADAANTLAEAAKAAAEGISLEEKDAAALAEIAKLAEKVAGVEGAMLKAADVEKMIADAQLSGAAADAATLEKINEALENLKKAAASVIGKRLTSLVYAPTEYINGIEAINFVNLVYLDWSTKPENWESNSPIAWGAKNSWVEGQVKDFGTYVNYLVSPAGVTMDGIKSLTYRCGDAINTRAKAKDVTITVVDSALVDGTLTLGLRKAVAGKTDADKMLPSAKLLKDMLQDLKVIAHRDSKVGLSVVSSEVVGKDGTKKYYLAASVDGVIIGHYDLYEGTDYGFEYKTIATGGKIIEASLEALFGGPVSANATVTLTEGQIEVALKNIDLKMDSNEQLIIAALEAKLDESVLDENEKKDGKEISVFSDWARLNESWETPKIHNALHLTCKESEGDARYESNAHFWKFFEIYDQTKRLDQSKDAAANTKAIYVDVKKDDDGKVVYDRTNWYVADEIVYDQEVDLYDYVKVCTQNACTGEYTGKFIDKKDLAKYGLSIEFNLMDYLVKNQGSTKDATNQKNFAKLSEDGILSSCAENGVDVKNKDAIGRTPVIQVVLRYTNEEDNVDAVVDVKYFKIKWIAEAPATIIYPEVCDFKYGFDCSDYYIDGFVLEKWMNQFYATVVKGGYEKGEFAAKYPYFSHLYVGELTEEIVEAISNRKFKETDYIAGTVDWRHDEAGSTQTQNLELTFDGVNPRVYTSKDKYYTPEQDYELDLFFYFKDRKENESSRIFVPVHLSVVAGEYHIHYDLSQFNQPNDEQYTGKGTEEEFKAMNAEPDKYRNVNPIQYSDKKKGEESGKKTAQIVASIPYGYMYDYLQADGKTVVKHNPETNAELVRYEYAEGTIQREWIKEKRTNPKTNAAWTHPTPKSNIVFDADRLAEANLPASTVEAEAKYKWFVTENAKGVKGKYLAYGEADKDGKLTKGYIAAVIDDDNNEIYLVDQPTGSATTGMEFDENSDPNWAARALVGKKAPIKVTADLGCKYEEVVDKYWFNFVKPLIFEEKTGREPLYDVKNEGSFVNIVIDEKVFLKENFGKNSNPIYLYKTKGINTDLNETLKSWYGLRVSTIDEDAALTDYNGNGKDDKVKNVLAEIKNEDGTPKYKIEVKLDTKTVKTGTKKVEKEVQETDADGNLVWTTDHVLIDEDGEDVASNWKTQSKKDADGNVIYKAVSVRAYVDGTDKYGRPVYKPAYKDAAQTQLVDGVTADMLAYDYVPEAVPLKDDKGNVIKDAEGNEVYAPQMDGTGEYIMKDGVMVEKKNIKYSTTPKNVNLYIAETEYVFKPKMVTKEVVEDVFEDVPNEGSATVKFHNMSGSAIAKGYYFDVDIPVKVETKWQRGEELVGYIRVRINSGLGKDE